MSDDFDEPLEKSRFPNRRATKMAVFDFIEGWYNPHRRHSAIGYLSPMQYETKYLSASTAA